LKKKKPTSLQGFETHRRPLVAKAWPPELRIIPQPKGVAMWGHQ